MLGFRSAIRVAPYAGVAVLTMMIALAVPIDANNWGSGIMHDCDNTKFSECVSTNGFENYWYFDVETDQQVATDHACTQVYDPVDIISCWEATTSSVAILQVYDNNVGSSYYSWTRCADDATYYGTDPRRSCDPQVLKYDLSHTTAYSTSTNRKKIGCHEMGHSFGLRHQPDGSASCMSANATTATTQNIDSHDELMLTTNYP